MNPKIRATIAAVLAPALLNAFFVFFLFTTRFEEAQRRVEYQSRALAEAKGLLAKKVEFEKRWADKKDFVPAGGQADEILNSWLKELLTYTQSQSITLDKLEPGGIREAANGKEASLFVSFQGDIRKAVSFFYHLIETDPQVKVSSFFVRQEEKARLLSFEWILTKEIKSR